MGEKTQSANQETEEGEIERLLLGIMEGYNDNVIPPLSYFSPDGENDSVYGKRQKTREASWVFKERKRREEMSEKFAALRSMVPSSFSKSKAPREKIISNAVDYIKYLQQERKRLEGLMDLQSKEKNMENPMLSKCTSENSSVELTVFGTTFLAIQLPSRRGLALDIVKVLEKHQAEVLEARICVNDELLLTFTATVRLGSNGGSCIDKVREELLTL